MSDLDRGKRRTGAASRADLPHALIGGYVVEGHVPLDAIQKLLKERPKIAGIGVGGMPIGSPGMENGSRRIRDVVAFDREGKTSVYLRNSGYINLPAGRGRG